MTKAKPLTSGKGRARPAAVDVPVTEARTPAWSWTTFDPAYGASRYISARLPQRFDDEVRRIARERGTTITGVLYVALERFLREEGAL